MNDLKIKVTKVVAEANAGLLTLIAQRAQSNGTEEDFLLMIYEQSFDNKEKIVKVLGNDLYQEMIITLFAEGK